MAKTKNQASLEAGLWNACNKLRGSVSATDYVNVVLGLLFLRFAYDKFNAQREKLLADEDTADFVENPRFYSKDNVFFLDENDRWSYIKDNSKSNKIFTYIDVTILLIEEPEAHLHPQLQVKFIKYLEALVSTLPNAQVIVSTHSPVLASSVKIDKLIHLVGKEKQIVSTMIGQKKFADTNAENYINRWLDVTKSTMLFSRGIILVEGIAEALVLPKLAEIVLKKYNQGQEEPMRLASTLDEMGVSVININGINFQYFMKLFGNFQKSSGPNIPIFCSGLTDRDPGKDAADKVIYPEKNTEVASKNPIVEAKAEIDSNQWTRLFVSPLKTFEYDLATYNPNRYRTCKKATARVRG